MKGLPGFLMLCSIFGIMPLLQGLYYLILAKDDLYLDRWRWFLGVPSALYMLWFLLIYSAT